MRIRDALTESPFYGQYFEQIFNGRLNPENLDNSSFRCDINLAPIITLGNPNDNDTNKSVLLNSTLLRNLREAPIPRATVAVLCTANALINVVSKINKIAGNCITPAPPPEKAENIFEIKDTINK